MIKLGQKVKCTVTGFTGIATSRVEYLNGCVQYGVTPKMMLKDSKDGKYPDSPYIDEGQLLVVGQGILVEKKTKKATKGPGGRMSNTPSARYSG